MKDEYTSAFYDAVKESQQQSGYALPEHVESYIVILLAHYVDRPNYLPESTFGETFLKLLQKPNNKCAKELGDTCLFVSGVFPTYGSKHGIDRRYYQDIGSTSYDMASVMNQELFGTLSTHFVFLSEFIEITVSSSKLPRRNLFR